MKIEERVLAALSYWSIFVLPIFFSFFVYLFSSNKDVKRHARKACFSHVLPVVWMVVSVWFLLSPHVVDEGHVMRLLVLAAIGLVNFVIFMWNLGNGIYVLIKG